MKHKYIFGCVVAAGVIGVLVWSGALSKNAAVVENEIAVSAVVTPLSLGVSYVAPIASSTWQTIAEATTVMDGSSVQTSEVGRAVIAADDEIITSLNHNSQVTLALSADGKQSRFELLTGETWSKVGRALEQDEVYEVYTPTMVAAVRGTSFGVSAVTERIVVTEGVVTVSVRSSTTGKIMTNTETLVTAGNTATMLDGNVVVMKSTEEDFTDWYYEHNPKPTPATETKPIVPASTPVTQTPPMSPPVITAPATTTPAATTTPETATTTPLSVASVRPTSFPLRERDHVSVRGTGFDAVTGVKINDKKTTFDLTSSGILLVDVDQLDDIDETYDLLFITDATELLVERAFTIEGSVEVVPLTTLSISTIEIAFGATGGNNTVIVTGAGFAAVESVQVDGVATAFTIVSDTEIVFDDVAGGDFLEVLISGNEQTVIGTMAEHGITS